MNPAEAIPSRANVFEKGNERYESIANAIGNAKEKVKGFFGRVKSGLGSLWKKTAVTALSTPEMAAAGAEYAGEKIVAGAAYAGDKLEAGMTYAGGKVYQGAQHVGQKVEQGTDWIDARVGEGLEWSANKIDQVKNFAEQKKDEAVVLLTLGKQTAANVVEYTKDKTAEKLSAAYMGLVNRYEKTKAFGAKAIASAEYKWQSLKDKWNMRIQAYRWQKLQAELANEKSMNATLRTMLEGSEERISNLEKKVEFYREMTAEYAAA